MMSRNPSIICMRIVILLNIRMMLGILVVRILVLLVVVNVVYSHPHASPASTPIGTPMLSLLVVLVEHPVQACWRVRPWRS